MIKYIIAIVLLCGIASGADTNKVTKWTPDDYFSADPPIGHRRMRVHYTCKLCGYTIRWEWELGNWPKSIPLKLDHLKAFHVREIMKQRRIGHVPTDRNANARHEREG